MIGRILDSVAIFFGIGVGLLLVHLLTGCTYTLEHEGLEPLEDITIGFDLEGLGDLCIGCFPVCSESRGYYCQAYPRQPQDCSQCYVGCILGKMLMCPSGGQPECYNDVGPTSQRVPVVCVGFE